MPTEAEIRKIVDEVIRRDEKTGEHVSGLGHLSYVSYKIDEINKPRRIHTDKGKRCQINYVYTVNVETEFLPHPDRLYGHTYRKMLLLDESGNIIAESKKDEIRKERETEFPGME